MCCPSLICEHSTNSNDPECAFAAAAGSESVKEGASMLSHLDGRSTALPSRCRLQFSQGSQPTSSQFLNSAMNKCCLESQSSQAAPMQEEPDVLTSQLHIPSQDFIPG